MKVLITGAGGQLGKELIQLFTMWGYNVCSYSRNQLDITNYIEVKKILKRDQPDILINTAAFTKVDLCETEPEQAYLVNAIGAYYLACQAKEIKAKFFHISTDYVFDGEKYEPYTEEDLTRPKTIYGRSKELGEVLALAAYQDTTVIRTSWLYGHEGSNFVNTIKQLASWVKEIRVVSDQYGCPTYTKDIGFALKQLLTKPSGIYHISNYGSCSWFEFANEILKISNAKVRVIPVSSEEYGSKTPRPMYSVLSSGKINSNGIFLREWKESLHEYLVKEEDKDEY
ncbi:dTDP-4-dehydrorhamnose reductase [Priestia aryabhattai]|uniref:dTDP-4-dehydrorhamnose reductase n=1 Tax=Priestia aryabhattai TaxID=412384 RepID=UPI00064E25D0|nr:dTDP-4-dehydrorhamnose reductase [Priestia aryabhattai]KML22991.1 dTDP-4-dehydrorhamnose reductase [Priestia aryabhattai]KMN99164.1 dTDP-4-dehydrorhamnose reductase [Priestia aryabhattai]